jgi:hypothetical protein
MPVSLDVVFGHYDQGSEAFVALRKATTETVPEDAFQLSGTDRGNRQGRSPVLSGRSAETAVSHPDLGMRSRGGCSLRAHGRPSLERKAIRFACREIRSSLRSQTFMCVLRLALPFAAAGLRICGTFFIPPRYRARTIG